MINQKTEHIKIKLIPKWATIAVVITIGIGVMIFAITIKNSVLKQNSEPSSVKQNADDKLLLSNTSESLNLNYDYNDVEKAWSDFSQITFRIVKEGQNYFLITYNGKKVPEVPGRFLSKNGKYYLRFESLDAEENSTQRWNDDLELPSLIFSIENLDEKNEWLVKPSFVDQDEVGEYGKIVSVSPDEKFLLIEDTDDALDGVYVSIRCEKSLFCNLPLDSYQVDPDTTTYTWTDDTLTISKAVGFSELENFNATALSNGNKMIQLEDILELSHLVEIKLDSIIME
ncbi:MAG: hypothetical protein ACOZAN_04870 [Patescibacteria group bacterium]